MNEQGPPRHNQPIPPDKFTLEEVYWNNVRDNQIGGETDGITPEVADDIGYSPPRPTERPDEPTEGPTPLFPGNDEELDAAIRRHPANPQTNKKRPQPFSGPVRGDSEGDTGNPAYHEPYKPLTDEQKATGKAWVEAARRILEQNRPDQQDQ